MAAATAPVREKQQSILGLIVRRFFRHRPGVIGLAVLVALMIVAVLAPSLAPHHPHKTNLLALSKAPDATHWLGTDMAGRDVLSRLIYASRVSIAVGFLSVALYAVIGWTLGLIAGYYGGVTDSIVMRVADMFLSFPSFLVIITVVSLVGPSLYNIILVIGLTGWPGIARIVRGMVLSLREREFVECARGLGASNARVLLKHILPHTIAPVTVAASYGIAGAVLFEAGLSFLGMGVQPPTASWGNMLTDAQSISVLGRAPWIWLPPGLMIAIMVFSINMVGDGLRDAVDPFSIVGSD